MLVHHLGGGPDVGVEADAEVGEFRLEGGGRDEPGVAAPDEPAARVARRVIGRGLRLHLLQGSASEDRPHTPAQQSQYEGQHAEDHQRHQQGDDDLVAEVRLVGVTDGAGGQSRSEMVHHPRRHRHPQETGDDEGNQQPPGIAAEPAVQGPGDHEP